MEINEMTLEELQVRATEIKAEAAEASEERCNAILAELENIEERKKQLEEIELRNEQAAALTAKKAMPDKTIEERKNTVMELTYAVGTPEYRSAWLRNMQGHEITVEERTAISAAAAIPTQTMNQIVSKLELNPLIAAIDVSHIPGNVSFPVESAVADASWVAMATAATDSTATLTAVTLGAYKLIKTVEVTADVMAMSIDAFEGWLTSRLANKIEKAVDAAILTGTGTSQAKGILTEFSTVSGTFTKAGMKYKDLMAVIAALPAEYANGATFVMPRALFYGEVIGMTDTTGNRVVCADAQSPAKFNILGYPVIVDDNCTADKLIFGDLKQYKFNFAKEVEVSSDASVAFRSGSTVFRAMALCDGKVATKSAFVVYERAAS